MTENPFLIPSAREVNTFHAKSDVDTDQRSQHHTLGTRHDQASPGDHTHDGTTSKQTSQESGSNAWLLALDAKIPADLPAAYDEGISLMIISVAGTPAWPVVPAVIITTKVGAECSQEARATGSTARFYRSWNSTVPGWRAWV